MSTETDKGPLMEASVKVQFSTVRPLSQSTGMKLWEKGKLKSLPGRCSYQLVSEMYEVDSLASVITKVVADIEKIVESENFPFHWRGIVVTHISASSSGDSERCEVET